MRSRLIPGKVRPISFIFVIPLVILAILIGLTFAQISFNLMVDYRLHQLESQISPCEVTESPQSEETGEVEQVFGNDIKSAESPNRGLGRNVESLGMFSISYYDNCLSCCGKTDGITFTGAKATPNHTIAVDPDVIPLGTQVMIDGILYTAEDIGGAIQGNRADIFVGSHQEALERGRHQAEVFKFN